MEANLTVLKHLTFKNTIETDCDMEKKRKLKKMFNISSDHLTVDDVQNVLEQLKLHEGDIIKEKVQKFFDELDVNNKGQINTEEFLTQITSNRLLESTAIDYKLFLERINEQLMSKSERVIEKLKKIKGKLVDDKESQEDIDWIISIISEEDLHEPEYEYINKEYSAQGNNSNAIDYIVKYSNIEDTKRRENDIIVINNLRATTMSIRSSVNFFNESVNELNLNKDSSTFNPNNYVTNFKRRNTRMSTFVSPSILATVNTHLANLSNFEFNIFELNDLVERKTTFYIAYEIFSRKGYMESGLVDEDKFKNFLNEIINGYDRKVAYHNDLHGGDVMQTVFNVVENGDLQGRLQLNDIDVFSILISALVHDYKHTGQNNMYHINLKSNLAIRYNDASVLENYSICETFKVIIKEESNILSSFTPEEYRISRRRIIESILATDMAAHQKSMSTVKTKIETFDIKRGKNLEKMIFVDNVNKTYENQQAVLDLVLHAADISSPAKNFKICEIWKNKVYEEFFIQGDNEKKLGLPVSILCDRETTNVNRSQIGFITFVVMPTFEVLVNFVPEVTSFVDNLNSNLRKYQNILKEEEKLNK